MASTSRGPGQQQTKGFDDERANRFPYLDGVAVLAWKGGAVDLEGEAIVVGDRSGLEVSDYIDRKQPLQDML